MRLKTDGARDWGDTPLGDAAFWLEETLALAAQIAENLPRPWPDELPGEEQAAEMLLAAEVWPEEEPAASAAPGEPLTTLAAGKQSGRKAGSAAAAGERGERRPQVSPGATHIVRRERDAAAALTARGTLKQREDVPETVTAPAAAPDLLNEWPAAEHTQELAATHTEETLPEVWREAEGVVDLWPGAGEVILAPEFYGLTAAAVTAAEVPEPLDMLPETALDEAAASQAAEPGPVIRQMASGRESSAPRLAESSTVFREAAAVDIDELAETVAERLQERLEIILQSRPFV